MSPQIVVVPGRKRAASNDSLFSPMGAPSAIPRPLFNEKTRVDEPLPREAKDLKKSPTTRRLPSYEGTGYRNEISVLDLHPMKDTGIAKAPSIDKVSKMKAKAPSRLPTPTRIQPVPYSGQLKTSAVSPKESIVMPRPPVVLRQGQEDLPRAVRRPSVDDPPDIPAKNPKRYHSARGHVTEKQLTRDEHARAVRIVSKENIRAALGGTSPDASTEDLNAPSVPPVPSQTRWPQVLQAYNTHMFPRKDQCNDMPRGK